jgi:hypothetical protein
MEILVVSVRNISSNVIHPFITVTTDFSPFTWTSITRNYSSTVEWNEKCNLDVARNNMSGSVLFTFYDKQRGKDISLGRCSISLYEIVSSVSRSVTKQLQFESTKYKESSETPAEISFTITFTERESPISPREDPKKNKVTHKKSTLQQIFDHPEVTSRLILIEDARKESLKHIPEESLSVFHNSDDYTTDTDFSFDNIDMTQYRGMDIVYGEKSRYVLGPKLVSAAYGVVRRGLNIKTQMSVAVKIISIDYCNEREIQIMRLMKDIYTVSYIDCQETDDSFYIVMEFCAGGDLFDAIEADNLDESRVKCVTMDILLGLKYLHYLRVCHRDIKPENILRYHYRDLSGTEKEYWKIADFGVATFFSDDQPIITEPTGTLQYKAPEMFPPTHYTKAVDLWATGISIYVCLTGRFLWSGDREVEIEESIRTGSLVEYEQDYFSFDAYLFMLRLLDRNPQHRITPDEALQHAWLSPL